MLFRLLGQSTLLMTSFALTSLRPFGYNLFTQTREGFGGKPFVKLHLQTMPSTDAPIGKHVIGDLPPIVRYLRTIGADNAIEMLHVSPDPYQPGDMAVIGPRPQLSEQVNIIEKLTRHNRFTRNLFCEWQDVRLQMHPGLWSSASLADDYYDSGSLEFHAHCMQADINYFYQASAALDLRLLLQVVAGGCRRAQAVAPLA